MESLTELITKGFLPELCLKGVLILSAAFAVTFALRRASASLRHAIWSLALIGLLKSKL